MDLLFLATLCCVLAATVFHALVGHSVIIVIALAVLAAVIYFCLALSPDPREKARQTVIRLLTSPPWAAMCLGVYLVCFIIFELNGEEALENLHLLLCACYVAVWLSAVAYYDYYLTLWLRKRAIRE
jgi:hypothetical protein